MTNVQPLGSARETLCYLVDDRHIVNIDITDGGLIYRCTCKSHLCPHINQVKEFRGLEYGEVSTKKRSYKELKQSGEDMSQAEQVYALIKCNNKEGLSRQEISELGDININAVCGRIQDLLNDKSIYCAGTRINHTTGKPVEYFKVV